MTDALANAHGMADGNYRYGTAQRSSLGVRIWRVLTAATRSWHHLWRRVLFYMPKQLYARSLLIVITPMILLQSALAFVFMECHWQTVTVRLSQAVTRDIASIIDLLNTFPSPNNYAQIIRISQERMSLKIDLLPSEPLPFPGPKPFFSILDQVLSSEIRKQINKPFWLDTIGNSNIVEVRVQLDDKVVACFRPTQPGLCLQHAHLFSALDGSVRLWYFSPLRSSSCSTRSDRSYSLRSD